MSFKEKLMYYHKKQYQRIIEQNFKNAKGLKQKLIVIHNYLEQQISQKL
ncbi:MAG: hypothetical protein ACRCVW_06865 [Brevinema sp.]